MLIATFHLETDAVALTDTLNQVPDVTIEAERVAGHATSWTMPCIWVRADDFDAVDEALAADSSVERIVEATEFVDEKYYQLDWDADVATRIDAYLDHEASILNASATADGWHLRIRFGSRDQFDVFRDELHERDLWFELLSIARPEDSHRPVVGLTPAQSEALRMRVS